MAYKANIEKLTLENRRFRKILFTTNQMQLVLMSLEPGEEIGREKHSGITQFIRIEKGKGLAEVGSKRYRLKDGDCIIIPSGKYHNIINTGKNRLKLYTLYAPPAH